MPKGGSYDKCLKRARKKKKVKNEYAYCSIVKKRHQKKQKRSKKK